MVGMHQTSSEKKSFSFRVKRRVVFKLNDEELYSEGKMSNGKKDSETIM